MYTLKKLLSKLEHLGLEGYEAYISDYVSGAYYDGEQHMESAPAVKIYLPRTNAYDGLNSQVLSILKRSGLSVKTPIHPYYNIYVAMRPQDRDRLDEAQKIADIFLNAFWIARHNGKDQNEMINAGRAAVRLFSTC